MKIATFNINNINRRLPQLLRWLRAAKPDVVCLQELKSTDADFPLSAIEKAGYGAVWRGQKTWNGVAILARKAEPVLIRSELPGDRSDHEARYIEAAIGGILVGCLYLPNGNPQPGPKFDAKLKWFKRLQRHSAQFLKAEHPRRAGRRLQRRAHRARHLSDALMGQGRADPAEKPRRIPGAAGDRAGSTRSARCIRQSRCSRSGITSVTAGRATPDCGSIICC